MKNVRKYGNEQIISGNIKLVDSRRERWGNEGRKLPYKVLSNFPELKDMGF